jgi:hypothetical protein
MQELNCMINCRKKSVRCSEDTTFAGSNVNHSNQIIESNLYLKLLKLQSWPYNHKHFESHLNDLTIVKKPKSIDVCDNDTADIFAVK